MATRKPAHKQRQKQTAQPAAGGLVTREDSIGDDRDWWTDTVDEEGKKAANTYMESIETETESMSEVDYIAHLYDGRRSGTQFQPCAHSRKAGQTR